MTQVNKTTNVKRVAATLKAALLPQAVIKFQFIQSPQELIDDFYNKRVQQFVDSDAELLEINDYNAVAIWVAPGKAYPSAQWDGPNACVDEFKAKANIIIQKLKYDKRPHWELSFIAKDPVENKGSISPLLTPYLKKAKEEGLPAILFAINDHAKDVYARYGFEVLETINIGKGQVDSNGDKHLYGEGVNVYFMVYNHVHQE